jgi:hypothetical protein
MNLKNDPTTIELAELLMPLNDNASDHITWVDSDGEVHISKTSVEKENAKFWYETLEAGNGYVGPQAANDQDYLEKELGCLKRDWAKDAEGFIEF